MSSRELVVLGTGSQTPTRRRNHNGYLLRWDGAGLLFDPGEGTQRQMIMAGVAATDVDRILISHFHGDHCLGVPGVIQRMSLDRVPHPVFAHFPAEGAEYFARLRHASSYHETATVIAQPVGGDGVIAEGRFGRIEAHALDHQLPTYGYRLVEPDGRRMLPERLREHGIAGPRVSELQREKSIRAGGRTVTLEEVSVPRIGQRFAFVMDTRLCEGVFTLADRADLLVIESTFLDEDARLAHDFGHLTAGEAGRVARECGVRRLVLTHFSQRYSDPAAFGAQAARQFPGEIVVAEDLTRVPVPPRSHAPAGETTAGR
ncbi:ribonuclease Z [Sphaerisporangium melleum]|uniref:ribonuclease Z n=1 Tax=Sphaerisporangium melleum TaxID=321316 RepID=UPI00166457B6|nr:ribonuclease Z [Sphaerisporangium melleum]GII74544.1 ribonuclease Z [Sphaerisporangium melleum]